jgi:DNA modification methylase
MLIEDRPLVSIRPYENNPRRNDPAVDAVAASIQEFGFRQPIVVDEDGVIIVGHTRFKAAHKLGLQSVPVHVAVGLTPAQVKAYRLADNQAATFAQWDDDRLVLELLELQHMQFDLDLTGFTSEEILRLTAPAPTERLADPDAIPDPPGQPVTAVGDLWLLGNHRLLCGDAAEANDVDRLLEGAPVHLVHTNPPDNVQVEPGSGNASPGSLPNKLPARDRSVAFGSVQEFKDRLHAWFGNIARVLLPGRAYYAWAGPGNLANYPAVLEACGLCFSQALIWVKEHPLSRCQDYRSNFELAFYGWKQGAASQFFGSKDVTDVWRVQEANSSHSVHPSGKPVELAAQAIENSSRPGEHVLDLFAGSGSTLIAAERAGRKAFLMELAPLDCDVVVRRWEAFTGQKAEKR